MKVQTTVLRNTVISMALLALITACGSGSDDNAADANDNAGPMQPTDQQPAGNPEPVILQPGDIPTLSPRARVMLDAPESLVDATLNPAGTEVAVLSQIRSTDLTVPPTYSVAVYDTNTGSQLRVLSELPADTPDALGIYWGSERISVLLFGGGFVTWDAASGAILSNPGPAPDGTCNVLSPVDAFDAEANVLYAVDGFNVPFICVVDFDSSTTQRRSVEMPSPSTQVESVALQNDGSRLWVSYGDNSLNITGTQVFDVGSFTPVGEFRSGNLGEIVTAADSFQIFNVNNLDLVLQPIGTELDGSIFGITASPQGNVLAQHAGDTTRVIAIKELGYIGELPRDNEAERSFNLEGTVGAFSIDGAVEIMSLTSSSMVSAIKPPTTFPRTLSGTLVIDNVSQSITGTCNALVEPGVGPNIIDIEATLSDGSRFFVRGQNLLGNVRYTLREGVQFTDSEAYYSHSTVAGQNFSLEGPMITTDGTAITGSTLLYQFSDELFGLVLDAADPTGFATRSLTLDATCM